MGSDFPSIEDCFYGSATIGERGQIVIPADARKSLNLHCGDKLLVFRHPMHPNMLILASVADMQLIHQQMSRAVEQMSERLAKEAQDTEKNEQ
ncbi:MAG TPA: AbrB/MazE/SpoVT family DNA-binding domain-containing protein [Armatimonadota bacterium]|jgi:AbrB family looped-hinge helix DNA binding protein